MLNMEIILQSINNMENFFKNDYIADLYHNKSVNDHNNIPKPVNNGQAGVSKETINEKKRKKRNLLVNTQTQHMHNASAKLLCSR